MLRGLLGEAVVRRIGDTLLALVVTETEAYLGPHDLVCHSARGRTPRTETMFGPPGTLYVFLVYGLYLMFNVVTGPEGFAMAVLIRSAGRAQGPGWLGRLTADLDGKPASQAAGLWFEDRAARPGRIMTAQRVASGYRPEMVATETTLHPGGRGLSLACGPPVALVALAGFVTPDVALLALVRLDEFTREGAADIIAFLDAPLGCQMFGPYTYAYNAPRRIIAKAPTRPAAEGPRHLGAVGIACWK